MTPYRNLGGKSGIVRYELAADSISVEFKNGWKYLYDYARAGAANVDQMKTLAEKGQGLSTFIDKINPPYSKKWR
jgi:hypothetical protein